MDRRKREALVRRQNRRKVFEHYGLQCIVCGEADFNALTIDHKRNDGSLHRAACGRGSDKLYAWLIRKKFPKGFQTLCYTCNCIKEHVCHGRMPWYRKAMRLVS